MVAMLKRSQEQIHLWRKPELSQVELMQAHYHTQRFSPHTHEGLAFGVIEKGALAFRYRGENVVAAPGEINLVYPGEIHTGHAADPEQGWAYRMFYFDTNTLASVAHEIDPKTKAFPFFSQGVIKDPVLAQQIQSLHKEIQQDSGLTLSYETRLLALLTNLIRQHATKLTTERTIGKEHRAVRRMQDYLSAYCTENISLDQLTAVANLSRYHLIRVFQKQVGIPPHKFLMQQRVFKAKQLIQQGHPLSHVAIDCGFTDQSHLNKHFKRQLGYTPGQYRNSVQDV